MIYTTDWEKVMLLCLQAFQAKPMEEQAVNENFRLILDVPQPLAKIENSYLKVLYHITWTEKSCWETIQAELVGSGNQPQIFVVRLQNGISEFPLCPDFYAMLTLVRLRLVELGKLKNLSWENHF